MQCFNQQQREVPSFWVWALSELDDNHRVLLFWWNTNRGPGGSILCYDIFTICLHNTGQTRPPAGRKWHPPSPNTHPQQSSPPTPNWWCGSLSHKFNSLHSPPFSSPLLPHCLIPSSPPPQVCWPPSFNYLASWFLFSTPIWVVQQKVGTRDTFVDWAAVRHIYVMICRFFLLVDCFCVRLHKERIDEMDPLISCHLMPCRHGPADLWVDL